MFVICSYVEQGFFQRWWKEQNENTKALVHKLVENGQVCFVVFVIIYSLNSILAVGLWLMKLLLPMKILLMK